MSYNKAQAYIAYVNALASMTVPLLPEKGFGPHLPVKFFNPGNGKASSVPVDMLVDTGAYTSFIMEKSIKDIGLKLGGQAKGRQGCTFNQCFTIYPMNLKIQVGSLKPLASVPFEVTTSPNAHNILGWRGLLAKAKLEVFGGEAKPQLTYSELAVAAMGRAGAYFRSRY